MLVLAAALGLLIGVALGALGGGGSLLTVPALVYLLGLEPAGAITSSLIIVGTTSLIALLPHARRGRVRFGQGLAFGVLGTAGSWAGSRLSAGVDPDVLMVAFATLMVLVAALMFRGALRTGTSARRGRSRTAEGAAEGVADPVLTLAPFRCDCPRLAKIVVAASIVGLLTGFFGVGGGFVLVPALVLALRYPMPVAVGTSLLVIAVNSATALAARLGGAGAAADLDWSLLGVFIAAAVGGSLVGAGVAGRVKPRQLTLAFATMIIMVAVYTAVLSVPALC
ncbi:MAG: sulfite exporter TauE/SafE family protein [Ornithinimicrobium sp.]|uniref:sulfite exporter TauE/SafE family protein n=1 Tax=Ornithinimicrobium sp. TaxID=1977084 RepID=UPI0026E0D581|nr:sulfite exporter TauE/SafE family protein [Ornithinimicrobium sp.]MDO5740487.1 sulfite exporter TauE/SafE family protein [Ornithinimicrobium sp.]